MDSLVLTLLKPNKTFNQHCLLAGKLSRAMSVLLFILISQISIAGNAPEVFSLSDTVAYKEQMLLAGNLAQTGELDSCISTCTKHIKKLESQLSNSRDSAVNRYLHNYLMYFNRICGMACQFQSDYPRALQHQQQYLKHAEAVNSIKDIGAAYTYIGYTHREMEDYKTALEYNTKAIKILQNTEYWHQYANAMSGRSTLYYDLGIKSDSAALFLENSIRLYAQLGDFNNYVNGTLSLCEQKFKSGKWRECGSWLNKIDSLVHQKDDPSQLAQYYVYKGRVEYMNKNLTSALNYFKKGYSYAQLTENPYNIHGTAKYMSLILAATGKYEESIKMIEECIDKYSDDVNTDKARELNSISLKFEFEKEKQQQQSAFEREKAIALEKMKRTALIRNVALGGLALVLLVAFLLYRLNNKLRQSYEALRKTQETLVLTEKQRAEQNVRVNIARDIHDELGSGLTRITMLSGLARKKIASQPQEVDASLQKITNYSRQVSASLNEIVWAVNPQSDTLEGLGTYMKGYAQKFLEDSDLPYKIMFPENYPNLPLDPETRRNIFLVLKESLNNIVKYAGATLVKVILQINNNQVTMEIIDDGKGMNSGEATSGNGLSNMRTRMEQSGFTFDMVTSPGSGCRIIISGKI